MLSSVAFTYDLAQADEVSQIRFLIADTELDDYELHNEEIQAVIDRGEEPIVEWRAYECAIARAGKLDRKVSASAGAVRIALSDRAKAAHVIVDRLWKLASLRGSATDLTLGRISLTGTDKSGNDLIEEDPDRESNRFRRNQFDRDDGLGSLYDGDLSALQRRGII